MECCGEALLYFKLAVTLFRSSIRYGIQSISDFKTYHGLCRIQNLVVDLQREAPYYFASQLQPDPDSEETHMKQKQATWGNLLV